MSLKNSLPEVTDLEWTHDLSKASDDGV